MKVTMEFDLPEEEIDAQMALAFREMHSALWNVDQALRSFLKHGGNATEVAEQCREEISVAIGRWS